MIHWKTGDLFKQKADIYVNPVNCVGVMGKGIAKEFKKRYPNMFLDYKSHCSCGHLQVGVVIECVDNGQSIFLFPTKVHWKGQSYYMYIERGLKTMCQLLMQPKRNCSIAIPALGCGNGGLEWEGVKPLIVEYLGDLSNDIYVFEPGGD